jgi:hypothetical protein
MKQEQSEYQISSYELPEMPDIEGDALPVEEAVVTGVPDEVAIEPENKDEVEVKREEPEEEEEEEYREPKARDSLKTRLNQIQREKYQALGELARVREELEQTRAQAELSSQAAVAHYDATVETNLAVAKQRLAAAKEAGDPQEEAEATLELARAVNAAEAVKSWKSQEAVRQRQQERFAQQTPPDPYESNAPMIDNWLNDNADWVMPNSPHHDARLTQLVDNYTSQWNANLAQNGLAHMIGSPEYLDHLNNYVHQTRQSMTRNPNTRSAPRVQNNRTPVAPARNSHQGGGRETYRLSTDEKQMIRDLKISPEAYVKAQLRDRKENATVRQNIKFKGV